MTKTYRLQPDMDVLTADGAAIGKVAHEEGPDRIKLTGRGGAPAYISWDWVDRVEDGKVHLTMDGNALEGAWQANPEGHIR